MLNEIGQDDGDDYCGHFCRIEFVVLGAFKEDGSGNVQEDTYNNSVNLRFVLVYNLVMVGYKISNWSHQSEEKQKKESCGSFVTCGNKKEGQDYGDGNFVDDDCQQ